MKLVTVVPRRVVIDAVMAERRRSAKVVANFVNWARYTGLPAARFEGMSQMVFDSLLREFEDCLDRVRRPWRVRQAERRAATPGRLRKCCGLCGGDDHRAPRCPGRPS